MRSDFIKYHSINANLSKAKVYEHISLKIFMDLSEYKDYFNLSSLMRKSCFPSSLKQKWYRNEIKYMLNFSVNLIQQKK